ncbi:tetratricopeptide repeat-containing sensor histidine kinase [Pontimicrobium sp. MEBiC01747]
MPKSIFIFYFYSCLFLASISTIDLNLYSETLTVLLKEAKSLEKQAEYKQAISVYNEALELALEENLITDASFIYKKIGLIYYKQKDYNKASINLKKSIKKDSMSQNAADSYFNLALIYRKLKEKDSLLWSLNNAVKLYVKKEDSKKKFSTFSKAGILYKKLGYKQDAIKHLLLAYNGFNTLKMDAEKATVSGNIGDIQIQLGHLEIAKKYYQEHLYLRLKTKDSLKISFAYNNLANFFLKLKQYDSASYHYNKALVLQKALNNKKNAGKTLSNLGIVYYLQNNNDTAKKMYKEALTLKKETNDTLSIVQTVNELALIAIEESLFKEAKAYIDEAELYLSSVINKDVLLRNIEVKSKYYMGIEDYKKGYLYKEEELKIYKELFNEKHSKVIQQLQEEYESKLKQQKIDELSYSNTEKKQTINNQKKKLENQTILLIILVGLIVLLIAFYVYLKQQQKIKEQQQEFKKLEAVFNGQELIKERISKDLHDIITTNYDGIRLKILALSKATNPESIGKTIINDIKDVNHQIKLISHRLSPLGDKIQKATLREIIVSQLSEFQHYRKIFVDVELPLPKVLDVMTLNAQTNLYGILLEVLSNIEKHSRATEVKITHFINDKTILNFKICDNGIGFQQKDNIEGIGLINIKQRALLLGGKHEFNVTESGVCIYLKIPIKENLK